MESDIVDDKLTRKILESARKQQDELEELVATESTPSKGTHSKKVQLGKVWIVGKLVCTYTWCIANLMILKSLTWKFQKAGVDSDEDDDDEWPALGNGENLGSAFSNEKEFTIDREDEKALEAFMNPNPPARRTLADVIMDKITGLYIFFDLSVNLTLSAVCFNLIAFGTSWHLNILLLKRKTKWCPHSVAWCWKYHAGHGPTNRWSVQRCENYSAKVQKWKIAKGI